ncbi:TRAP transporter large permease [Chloroflexota bacterium]
MDLGVLAAIVAVCLLFVFLMTGVPIAFSLGTAGVIGIFLVAGGTSAWVFLSKAPFAYVASWVFIIVPMFILMGNLAFSAGIGKDAYSIGYKWLGRVPGGLALATIAGCAGFAATCGSSVATAATVGKVAIPEMRRYKYDLKLAFGSVGAGGTFGVMIPPSGILVIYGILAEQSIGRLLMAGLLPGILSAILYFIVILVWVKLKPNIAPKPDISFTWKERLISLKGATGVIVLFLIVMGGIYTGFFTPTEASAVGAVAAFIILLIRSKRHIPDIRGAFGDGARTTSMIFTIMIGGGIFGALVALSQIPQSLSNALITLNLPPIALLILILIPYVPLGMLLDPVSALVLTIPIILPFVQAAGFDGIWFGILVTKLIEVSMVTPPVGMNLFILKGLWPEIGIDTVIKGCLPFLVMDFITLGILIAFPSIALFLPNMMMG